MTPQRESQIDFSPDALDEAPDLGQIRRGIEVAVGRTDDVDFRPLACAGLLACGYPPRAVLSPQPVECPVGALPLILIDRARQEALDVGSFRCHSATNHLGD